MASSMNAAAFAVDADNRLLWRMNPRRMDVEAWRDAMLAATGELDLAPGGPPVESLLNTPRRTLYAAVSRNGDRYASDSFLRLFDFPLPRATSEGRGTSVVPQQSLFLMNSEFMAARSRALAARLEREVADDTGRIDLACRLLFGRPAEAADQQLGQEFLAEAASSCRKRGRPRQVSRQTAAHPPCSNRSPPGSNTLRFCSAAANSCTSNKDLVMNTFHINPLPPFSRRESLRRMGAGFGSMGLAAAMMDGNVLAATGAVGFSPATAGSISPLAVKAPILRQRPNASSSYSCLAAHRRWTRLITNPRSLGMPVSDLRKSTENHFATPATDSSRHLFVFASTENVALGERSLSEGGGMRG
jgi:hypothetical protein